MVSICIIFAAKLIREVLYVYSRDDAKLTQRVRKISLNANLVDKVEAHIDESKTYRSIAEFVNEAMRLRLKELGVLD